MTTNSDKEKKLAINKYGAYPFDLYGILESLKGNDESKYTALQAFHDIEELIAQEKAKWVKEVADKLPEKIDDVEALWSSQSGDPLTYNQAIKDVKKILKG